MSDQVIFNGQPVGQNDPAQHAQVVTPGASALSNVARALWVGVAGNVEVTTVSGETVTFVGVGTGVLPVSVTHVIATNTTATNILALW